MGLKSGSRDAGLDDEDDEPSQEESTEADSAKSSKSQSETPEVAETETSSPPDRSSDSDSRERDTGVSDNTRVDDSEEAVADTHNDSRPSMDSIPYKLRRDKVNEGREQVPYFLREHVIEAEDDLKQTLESILDETVYKSDYREAAMIVAQENPELVAEVLRDWGYDLDAM